MADDSKKVSELVVTTSLSANDRLVVLTNVSSAPNVQTITASNFANTVAAKLIVNTAPASNTSNGVAGQIAYSNSFIYVCIANNTWARASLNSSW